MAEPTPAAEGRAPRWVHAGALLAGLAGAAHLGLLYYIFFSRVGFPLDLEWMESGMLCHALRAMEGQPIYGPPSVEFISYLYTPGYPLLLASLGKVFGLSYLLGRLVSIAAFSAALSLVVLAVRRQAGGGWVGALWGLCAAGLIACSFQHTGAWFDLVRNDSLYLGLVLGYLYLLRYQHQSWRLLVLAGVLAGLSFLTKQTASMFIVLSGLALLLTSWRRLPVYVAVVGLVAGGGVLLANQLTDGWFWRYIYEMHQGHGMRNDWLWPKTHLKLLKLYPLVFGVLGVWLLTAPAFWIRRRQLTTLDRGQLYWLAVALAGVTISAVGFATQWASDNAFIPGFLFPSAMAAMAAADLVGKVGGRWSLGRSLAAAALGLVLGGALAAQLGWQLYRPGPHIPEARDRETGAALIERLRQIDGPVLMPYHPYYPVLAGKRPGYHQMGVNDVTHAGYAFPPDIQHRITRQHYAAVILDNPPAGRYDFIFDKYKLGHYFKQAEVPRVVAGYQVRPTYLFVPKRPDPPPPDGRVVFDFEQGGYRGWTLKGSAFGPGPVGGPIWPQGPLGPFGGSLLVNSFHGADPATGTLRSPEFSVDHRYLDYLVGGGNNKAQLAVRLLIGDREVYRGSGSGSDIMQQRRVDLGQFLGQQARLELVDHATGPWGHLLFDHLTLRDK